MTPPLTRTHPAPLGDENEFARAFGCVNTGTVSNVLDEMGINGVILGIRPVGAVQKSVGYAVTVKEETLKFGSVKRDEFAIGHVIGCANAGDVIVVDNCGHPVSTWGGVASLAGKMRGLAGVIVHGAVRDIEEIDDAQFAVFARVSSPRTGRGRIRISGINVPIQIDDVNIFPGDIVIADSTAIVVVPRQLAGVVASRARQLSEQDDEARALLREGHTMEEAMQRYSRV